MSFAYWCSTCFCVVLCVGFCMGHFVIVPLNLTYLHCLKHSFFEHHVNSLYCLNRHIWWGVSSFFFHVFNKLDLMKADFSITIYNKTQSRIKRIGLCHCFQYLEVAGILFRCPLLMLTANTWIQELTYFNIVLRQK